MPDATNACTDMEETLRTTTFQLIQQDLHLKFVTGKEKTHEPSPAVGCCMNPMNKTLAVNGQHLAVKG